MEKIPCTPSLGADPEWFLTDAEGQALPACGLIGGTKEEPLALGGGFCVQEDNVMVEWNIPASDSWETFYHNINDGIEAVDDHVKRKVGKDYGITAYHEWTFSTADLASEQAQTFGCEPDYDAYLGGVMRQDGAHNVLGNTRTAGGHIHVGGDFQCPDFVAALFAELAFGVFASIPVNPNSTRAQWYGRPGIFRSKPYGIEYRTPDNTWTGDTVTVEGVAMYGMRLAEYLTNNSADKLQSVFRQFPWVQLRAYMDGSKRSYRTRKHLIELARAAGVNW